MKERVSKYSNKDRYTPTDIEPKWVKRWEDDGIYRTKDVVEGKKNYFALKLDTINTSVEKILYDDLKRSLQGVATGQSGKCGVALSLFFHFEIVALSIFFPLHIYIPQKNAHQTDISIEEGMKIIISAGMLAPKINQLNKSI